MKNKKFSSKINKQNLDTNRICILNHFGKQQQHPQHLCIMYTIFIWGGNVNNSETNTRRGKGDRFHFPSPLKEGKRRKHP